MRDRYFAASILVVMLLAFSQPLTAVPRATWNSDGTCSGYPEAMCVIVYRASSGSTGEGITCITLLEDARRSPLSGQVALVNSVISSHKRDISPWGGSRPLRVQVNIPDAWITAGAWTKDGQLLLLDSIRGELLRIEGSGHLTRADLSRDNLYARDMRETEGGLLLKLHDGRFVVLNPRGQLERVLDRVISPEGKEGVQGIFNWTPFAGSILAFGDIQMPDRTWKSGWVNIPFDDSPAFEMVRSTSVESPERKLYLLGNSYIAADNEAGYILSYNGPQPQLLKISRKGGELNQKELPWPPSAEALLQDKWPDDVVKRYGVLERHVVPAGLYVQDQSLYLLIRRPAPTPGDTEWELLRLDRNSGIELNRVHIPTKAKHLLVIPGKERWAFVEKGSVLSIGEQKVEGLLTIPTAWIKQDRSSEKITPDVRMPEVLAPLEGLALGGEAPGRAYLEPRRDLAFYFVLSLAFFLVFAFIRRVAAMALRAHSTSSSGSSMTSSGTV